MRGTQFKIQGIHRARFTAPSETDKSVPSCLPRVTQWFGAILSECEDYIFALDYVAKKRQMRQQQEVKRPHITDSRNTS